MEKQKRKPFSTLAQELKAIRQKAFAKNDIEKTNSVLQDAPTQEPIRKRAKPKDAEI